jgi:cellulose synthase/poly-beta-1,6-N-acetylglucosamine synthase-like glycosyltransferase
MSGFMLFASTSVLLALLYIFVQLRYLKSWEQLPDNTAPPFFLPQSSISILVPARNEAATIGICLESLRTQDYPKQLFEIIVIDDHSTDETSRIVQSYPDVQCIHLSEHLPAQVRINSYKKEALDLGVRLAKNELIVCTDADCIASPNWLRHIACSFESKSALHMLTGPVLVNKKSGFVGAFQAMDFIGMMAITAAGYPLGWHQMGNGANLAYRKSSYLAVGGFNNIKSRASGDDLFLLEKMEVHFPGGVQFLKSNQAVVFTQPEPDLKSFFLQRLRWGSKNSALRSLPIRLILLLVLVFSIATLAALIYLLFNPGWKLLALTMFLLFAKTAADAILLRSSARFWNASIKPLHLVLGSGFHTLYICLTGLSSLLVRNYSWKGRNVR